MIGQLELSYVIISGVPYYALGDYLRAMEHQEQCFAISRDLGDRLGEGQSLGSLGSVYDALGDYLRAICSRGIRAASFHRLPHL